MAAITKEVILGLNRTVTEQGCWILEHLKGYPQIYDKQTRRICRISRLVAHLWHGLDLDNRRKLK